MRQHYIAAGLLMLCSLPLSGCGGGGGSGGGGAGIAPPTGDMPPSMSSSPYGTYGNWNRAIENAFAGADYTTCTERCDTYFPARPAPIRSPFGDTAAFDPATDQWAAEWTGTVEGYTNHDPDSAGPMVNRWDGTAHLQIRAEQPSQVPGPVMGLGRGTSLGGRRTGRRLAEQRPGHRGASHRPTRKWYATLERHALHRGRSEGLFHRQRDPRAVRHGAGGQHTVERRRTHQAQRPHGGLRGLAVRRAGRPAGGAGRTAARG